MWPMTDMKHFVKHSGSNIHYIYIKHMLYKYGGEQSHYNVE